MTTETNSHRLVNLRMTTAGCSCGQQYVGEGSADLRAQHRSHKANPVPAKKATPAKAAPAKATAPTKATVKPRPSRKATAK